MAVQNTSTMHTIMRNGNTYVCTTCGSMFASPAVAKQHCSMLARPKFQRPRIIKLESLNDAVDRPLKVGDFVTAIFGEVVQLFEVTGFEKVNISRKQYILLKRKFASRGIKKETAEKIVRKGPNQVTYVDPLWLMQRSLER